MHKSIFNLIVHFFSAGCVLKNLFISKYNNNNNNNNNKPSGENKRKMAWEEDAWTIAT